MAKKKRPPKTRVRPPYRWVEPDPPGEYLARTGLLQGPGLYLQQFPEEERMPLRRLLLEAIHGTEDPKVACERVMGRLEGQGDEAALLDMLRECLS